MRYEVPQFIEVEQHVIGPFTWKQFIYLAGGAGAVILTYLTLPFILFMFTGVPIAILAIFLAYRKVNGRSFEIFLEAVFNFFTHTKLYRWNIDESRKYTVTYAEKPEELVLESESSSIQQTEHPRSTQNIGKLQETLQEKEMSLITPTITPQSIPSSDQVSIS